MLVKRTCRTLGLTTLLLAALGSLWGSQVFGANSQEKPAAGSEVKIDNFSFAPAAVTVPVGTSVTWVNRDDIPHTVVSTTGNFFKSKALDTDEKFSYTFTKAGTYPYFCSLHPKMTGKIVVQ
jgi:plastocyanin